MDSMMKTRLNNFAAGVAAITGAAMAVVSPGLALQAAFVDVD
jgi:hypothetical protein